MIPSTSLTLSARSHTEMDEAKLRASRQVNRAFWEHYLYQTIVPNDKTDSVRVGAQSEYIWYWYVFVPLRQQIEAMYGVNCA